jgi:hypothetical protein
VRVDAVQRILGRALLGWRPRNLLRRLRSIGPRDLLIGYGLLACIVLVALCGFIARPVEPFGFSGDLGFAHETVSGALYTVHSATDAFDAIGWSPWFNYPLLYLNSNVSEAFLTVVARLSGNVWLAIKIVQVFEVIASIAAAYAMYATYSRGRFWAIVFGLSYAALPITALAIRGNLTLGWIAVLAPATIAAGTLLVRKYGARAIPLVGFLCGFAGYGIALEYAAFSSLPLFALILAGERRRVSLVNWLTWVPLGLVCCIAMGAFYVLPTFVAPIASDAAARTATLQTGAFLLNFSQTWPGLLTLVTRESYVSLYPEYNAGGSMPYLYAFGAVLWFAALANLWKRKRSGGWADYASIGIVFACIVLAMGTAIPLGQELWKALFTVPHLNAIRTTDRFLTVPALMLTFWYVCTLERVAIARPVRIRAAGWLGFVVLVAFICFDVSQHCFSLDPSEGTREPELAAVQSVVESRGGRTVSFAGINGGASFESASEYGIPQPTTPAAVDLGWRYIEDGNGSVGVIGRTGVRTIISAPNWTGALDFPNASAIYRHLPAAPIIFRSPEDVLVAKVVARDAVSAVTPICVYGGPGGFDLLDNVRQLQGAAFLEQTEGVCPLSGFVNFDPRDRLIERPESEAWAGARLLPGNDKIRDVDYPFLPNRSLLNIPWYRNSIDGDRPLFDASGAIEVAQPTTIVLPQHKEWPTGTSIALRLCSHAGGTVHVSAGSESLGKMRIDPGRGLRWYEIRTTHPIPAETSVTLTLEPAALEAGPIWTGFAFDGAAVFAPTATIEPLQRPAAFLAISLDRLARMRSVESGDDVLTPLTAGPRVVETNMHYDSVKEAPAWVADAATSVLRIKWTGPAGPYVIQVKAELGQPNDTIGIDATREGTCCRVTTSNSTAVPGTIQERFELHTGSNIVVRLVSPNFKAQYENRIVAITVRPVRALTLSAAKIGSSATIDFTKPYDALAALSESRGISIESTLAYGEAGSELRTTSTLNGHPKSVELEVQKAGLGSATAELRCDGAVQEIPLRDDDSSVAVSGSGFNHCSTRIRWSSGNLGIHLIRLVAGGASLAAGTTSVWIPAGTYRASIVEADGTILRRPPLHASGCVGAEPVCTFANDALRNLTLGESPSEARLLLFTSLRPIAPAPAASITQSAALRWNVSVDRTASLGLTQIYDGNWILSNGSNTYYGERCDIANTCFPNVAPGAYRLYHRYPRALWLGIAITLASFLFAIAVAFVRSSGKRAPAF